MGLPENNPGKSKLVAEAALEEVPSIDSRLVEAVQNPLYRHLLLFSEERIQYMMQNHLPVIDFPQLYTPYLTDIMRVLARHYGLEITSIDNTGVHARRTPATRQPLLTLSSIPPVEPEAEIGDNFTSTDPKIQSVGSSSSNLDEPERRVINLEEKDKEYYKARGRNLNEAVPSSYTPAAVPHSISDPVHGTMVREGKQDDVDDRGTIRNPGSNFYSNQIGPRYARGMKLPSVNLHDASNIQYQPVQYQTRIAQSQSIQPGASVCPNTVAASGRNPLYNLANAQSMPSYMVPSMQSPTQGALSIRESELLPSMQSPPGYNLKPVQQPRPEAAQWPSTSVAFQNQDVVNVPHQRENQEIVRSERSNFNVGRTSADNMSSTLPSAQLVSQELEAIRQKIFRGMCSEFQWEPSLPPYKMAPLDRNKTSTSLSMLQSSISPLYNPASSSHKQLPVLQSTQQVSLDHVMPSQPRPEAAQPPSTNVAFQNQDVIYVHSSSEDDDETDRAERRGSTAKRGRLRKNTRPN